MNMITNWNTTLTDARGDRWHFHYAGGTVIRIRSHTEEAGNWTNSIDLNYESKRPADVTDTWLTARTAEWITDRNGDLASGLYG